MVQCKSFKAAGKALTRTGSQSKGRRACSNDMQRNLFPSESIILPLDAGSPICQMLNLVNKKDRISSACQGFGFDPRSFPETR